MITSSKKIKETALYDLWKEQKFLDEIFTVEGDKLEILDIGEMNGEIGGPDFKNARIKIGNITYIGDVEIDCFHSDWKSHGHSINKKFNKVILHAVLKRDNNTPYVLTENGRKIPTISFEEFIDHGSIENLVAGIQKERKKNSNLIRCSEIIELTDEKTKLYFLYELGVTRFKKKCEKVIIRLKELNYLKSLQLKEPDIRYDIPEEIIKRKIHTTELNDKRLWEQVFYEFTFEALGYTQNKDTMRKLAQAVDIDFLKSISTNDNPLKFYEAALFNVAGLLPDVQNLKEEHTSEYTRKLYENWVSIRNKYSGKILSQEAWHFFRLRPQNFPTVRIAGGARLINRVINRELIKAIMRKFKQVHSYSLLLECLRNLLIIKTDGYWGTHYVFDKPLNKHVKYLIGSNRADEIILNVVLPFVYVYFDLFEKKYLAQKVLKLFTEIKCEIENSLVKEMACELDLKNSWNKAVIYQGLLELYRTYCSKHDCNGCKIGQKIYCNQELE